MKLYSDGVNYYLTIHQNRKDLPYLIMFHGFMGSGQSFDPLIQLLTPFCNPVTIDLIGHGMTGGPINPNRYSVEKQISDIRSILDRIKLSPLIIYGYSMGGRLVLNLLSEIPNYFQGVILESTTCGIQNPDERRKRAGIDEDRAREIEKDFTSFLNKWINLPLFSNNNRSPIADENYKKVMSSQRPELLAASLRGFGTGNMESVCNRLSLIDQRILLIAGNKDAKFVRIHRKMEQLLPVSNSVEIVEAGHRVHLDQPVKFINEIKKFINQLSL
jgi:2-succinyl-6-hydroxy-2,4-cyclohexadiene-1-carboxylate synthase